MSVQAVTNHEERLDGERRLADFQQAGRVAGALERETDHKHKVIRLDSLDFAAESQVTGARTIALAGDPTLYERWLECRDSFPGTLGDWLEARRVVERENQDIFAAQRARIDAYGPSVWVKRGASEG